MGNFDAICSNTCKTAKDGVCDDGGFGSTYADCEFGTDCDDCGIRSTAQVPEPTMAPTMVDNASCANRCGSYADGKTTFCSCDEHCSKYGDCCADYQTACPKDPFTGWTDIKGDGCPWYKNNPGTCNAARLWKLGGWSAHDACDACRCVDNPKFEDSRGDGCCWYNREPKLCLAADVWMNDDGETAESECCVCKAY